LNINILGDVDRFCILDRQSVQPFGRGDDPTLQALAIAADPASGSAETWTTTKVPAAALIIPPPPSVMEITSHPPPIRLKRLALCCMLVASAGIFSCIFDPYMGYSLGYEFTARRPTGEFTMVGAEPPAGRKALILRYLDGLTGEQ
jgi:hypothetical protein